MIWRIEAKRDGQHEVIAESNIGGTKQSCGKSSDLTEIEAFVFQHAKPNDMVCYPDGSVARVLGMALA